MSEKSDASFYEQFVSRCVGAGKAPSRVALEVGFSKSMVNRWKNGGKPTDATLVKIANYFGVRREALLEPTCQVQKKGALSMSETKVLPRETMQELLDVTRELFGEDELNEEQMSRLFDQRQVLSLILADLIGIGRSVMRGLVDTLVSYDGLKREAAPEDVVMVLNAFGWNVEVSE